MDQKDIERLTITTGLWRYNNEVDEVVRIIGLPYDYWYAMGEADGNLAPDEIAEALGDLGLLYYAYFASVDGPGFPTVLQAQGYAQSKVRQQIRWK